MPAVFRMRSEWGGAQAILVGCGLTNCQTKHSGSRRALKFWCRRAV